MIVSRVRLASPRTGALLALALIASSGLAACGGSDDEESKRPPTPAATTTTTAGPGGPTADAIKASVAALDLNEPAGLSVEAEKKGDRYNVVVAHNLGPRSPANRARVRARADAAKILKAIYTGGSKAAVARVVVRSMFIRNGEPKVAVAILMVGSTGRVLNWNAPQARIERSWEVVVDRL